MQTEPEVNVASQRMPPLRSEIAARGRGPGKTGQRVSVCVVPTELWIYTYLINSEWKPREAV